MSAACLRRDHLASLKISGNRVKWPLRENVIADILLHAFVAIKFNLDTKMGSAGRTCRIRPSIALIGENRHDILSAWLLSISDASLL